MHAARQHVYVEKRLTRTPAEAHMLLEAANKYKVATQMWNQGFSHEAHRVDHCLASGCCAG